MADKTSVGEPVGFKMACRAVLSRSDGPAGSLSVVVCDHHDDVSPALLAGEVVGVSDGAANMLSGDVKIEFEPVNHNITRKRRKKRNYETKINFSGKSFTETFALEEMPSTDASFGTIRVYSSNKPSDDYSCIFCLNLSHKTKTAPPRTPPLGSECCSDNLSERKLKQKISSLPIRKTLVKHNTDSRPAELGSLRIDVGLASSPHSEQRNYQEDDDLELAEMHASYYTGAPLHYLNSDSRAHHSCSSSRTRYREDNDYSDVHSPQHYARYLIQ